MLKATISRDTGKIERPSMRSSAVSAAYAKRLTGWARSITIPCRRSIGQRLKRYGNARITKLRASGRLYGSLHYETDDRSVRWGTPVVYAAIHNLRGMTGRNRKVKIPQREYLGFGEQDLDIMEETVEDWLARP